MASVVSGFIAVLLLLLYAYAISILIRHPDQEPSSQIGTILGLVGGLVSALVVAVLAITPPDESIAFAFGDPGKAVKAVKVVTSGYLIVWIICGVVLVVTWMRTPTPAKSLAAAATSWLGLAVAAGYTYLGLK